jgi:hypothetical protein
MYSRTLAFKNVVIFVELLLAWQVKKHFTIFYFACFLVLLGPKDHTFHPLKEFLDLRRPSNRLKTDKARRDAITKMGFEPQYDEDEQCEGVYIKKGAKVIRRGKRVMTEKSRREKHDTKAEAAAAHEKASKSLVVLAKTEDKSFLNLWLRISCSGLLKYNLSICCSCDGLLISWATIG